MSPTEETVFARQKTGFWDDLTGRSDRWIRTLVWAVIVGRLSLIILGVIILLVASIGSTETAAMEAYSGLTDVLDAEWVFVALVFAPLTESLSIIFLVWLLGGQGGWRWPVWATALICAIASVPFHGLGPLSLAVAPFFALMAVIQHNWMLRGRIWAGFWLIVAIHFAANALGVLGMWGLSSLEPAA